MTLVPLAPIDPFDPALRADPHGVYAALREHDPLHRSSRGAWVVTRHADCSALLADSRFAHWAFPTRGEGATRFERIVSRWLQWMHPGERTRLRALTARMFSPGRTAAMQKEIETLAGSLAAECADRECFDVVGDFADPLTLTVIGRQLGVPQASVPRFAQLAVALRGSLFALLGGGAVAPAQEAAANEFADLICSASGEVVDALAESDPDDFAALAIVFLFAGHENTTNFIASALRTLLLHGAAGHGDAYSGAPRPPGRRRLREADLDDCAIEELLRFESPVQFVSLTAREPVTLAHGMIGVGDQVLAGIGAANRDPRVFRDPDALDLARDPNPHLALGHGPFFCIGAPMARMEATAALRALLRCCDDLELDRSEPVWREGPLVLRGLRELPVCCGGAA